MEHELNFLVFLSVSTVAYVLISPKSTVLWVQPKAWENSWALPEWSLKSFFTENYWILVICEP